MSACSILPSSWPCASNAAEMPVLAARSSGSPSSTARIRAAARCWRGPVELPNQASLVTFTSQAGRSRAIHDLAGEDRLVADQRAERRQARDVQRARSRARGEAVAWHHHDRQRQPVRDVLAERHQVPLVVNAADRAAIAAPRTGCCAGAALRSKRTLPISAGAPPVACSIACRAGSSRSSRPGNDGLRPDRHGRAG